jgi:hypothetical protein
VAVRAAGFDTWRDFILDKLDYNRMIDESTGKPIIPERVELALRGVHETIATEGANKLTASGQARGRSMANRRLDHRFLVFKSADDWMNYQERFGDGNPFDTMFGHFDGMARDIAQMEILGPNPQAGMRYMKDVVTKDAMARDLKAGGDKHSNAARARLWVADSMLCQVGKYHGWVAQCFGFGSIRFGGNIGHYRCSFSTDGIKYGWP